MTDEALSAELERRARIILAEWLDETPPASYFRLRGVEVPVELESEHVLGWRTADEGPDGGWGSAEDMGWSQEDIDRSAPDYLAIFDAMVADRSPV